MLFSGYFRSADRRIVSIVSGGCDQSSSAFFYSVFELYQCVNAIFNTDKSSSHTFLNTYRLSTSSLGCKALCMVISFLIPGSFVWNFLWFTLRRISSILRGVQPSYLPLLWGSCNVICSQVGFSFSWDTLIYFFFHFHLFDDISFQYSQVFVWFLFSVGSDFFSRFGCSIPSVMCRLLLFITRRAHFSYQIPPLYLNRILYQSVVGFPILFDFLQTVWFCPCTLSGWSFLAIC